MLKFAFFFTFGRFSIIIYNEENNRNRFFGRKGYFMKIAGLQKLTLLDFPGKVACTVFTDGCNFRCPFCHNASLVLPNGHIGEISEEEFFAFLKKREGILDGVVVTGGEPTLASGLYEFIAKVKSMGYLVKLDSNGSMPDKLRVLIDDGLLDYIAMDIKTVPEKYDSVAGVKVDGRKIRESMDRIRHSGIPHEFRTTVVKGLHTKEDIVGVAKLLGEGEAYYLQSFVDSGDILSDGCEAFSAEEMHAIADEARRFCPTVQLRGIE